MIGELLARARKKNMDGLDALHGVFSIGGAFNGMFLPLDQGPLMGC